MGQKILAAVAAATSLAVIVVVLAFTTLGQ